MMYDWYLESKLRKILKLDKRLKKKSRIPIDFGLKVPQIKELLELWQKNTEIYKNMMFDWYLISKLRKIEKLD